MLKELQVFQSSSSRYLCFSLSVSLTVKQAQLLHLLTLRSSSSSAAQAFAAATAGSSNPRDQQGETDSFTDSARRKISITHSAATMRVLSVLRHWITKHSQVTLPASQPASQTE